MREPFLFKSIKKGNINYMKSAIEIAKAILKMSEPEIGDSISNLKLQKLLYYIQGFSLIIYGKPMFKEKLVAWEHGPVVEEVYHKFKECGAAAISIPTDSVELTKEEADLIVDVWKVYGQFSAWKLRDMTHNEAPWKNTEKYKVIEHEVLRDFFKTLVEA